MPPRRDYDQLFADTRTAFTNARDLPEVQALLAPFGYDPVRLDAGLALIDAAEETAQPVEAVINELIDTGASDAIVGMHLSATRQRLSKIIRQRIPYVYTPLYEGGETTPGIYAIGDLASYPGKLKLILQGFSEAAMAAHHMYGRVFPGEALHFEHSTTKGLAV